MGQWRKWLVVAQTVRLAVGGAVGAAMWATAASDHRSGPGAVMLALVVVLPAMAVTAGLIQAWRTRAGRRAQPPTPYDIVAAAERVLAREEAARVTDAALGALQPELFAYGWRSWRRAGRGAVVLDLRGMLPVRLSYLPRAALQVAFADAPGPCTRVLGAVDSYRPPDEVLVVVYRAVTVRAYRLTAARAGEGLAPAPFLDIEC
jgi:hypothetical protein